MIVHFVLLGFDLVLNELNVSRLCENDLCYPKVVWAYWNAQSIPDEIQLFIDFTKKSLINFTFCLITPTNMSKYVDVKLLPPYFRKVHVAGQADYVRVCLLEKYGGIYIDASTYISSERELDWLISEGIKNKSEFITFEVRLFNKFSKLEFSYIGASEKSSLMKRFRDEVERALTIGSAEYVKQTCLSLRLDKLPIPEVVCKPPYSNKGFYFLDVAFENVILRNATLKGKVLFLPENRSNYHIWCDLNWDKSALVKRILDYPGVFKEYPIIKINGALRIALKKEKKERVKNSKRERNERHNQKKKKWGKG